MNKQTTFWFEQSREKYKELKNISINNIETAIGWVQSYEKIINKLEHLVISINSDKPFVWLEKSRLGLLDIYLKKEFDKKNWEISQEEKQKIIEKFDENNFSEKEKLFDFAISQKDFSEYEEIVKKYFSIIDSLEKKIKDLIQENPNSSEIELRKFKNLKRKKERFYENKLIFDLYNSYKWFDEKTLDLVIETRENFLANISFKNFKNENLWKTIESALKDNFYTWLSNDWKFTSWEDLKISYLEKNIVLSKILEKENWNIESSFSYQDWNLKIISENNFISFPIEFNKKWLIKNSKEKLDKVSFIIKILKKFNLEYEEILKDKKIKKIINNIKNNLISNPQERDISFLENFLKYLKLLIKDWKLEKMYDILWEYWFEKFLEKNDLKVEKINFIEKLYELISWIDVYSFKETYFKWKLDFEHNKFSSKEYKVHYKNYKEIDFSWTLGDDGSLIIEKAFWLNEKWEKKEINLYLIDRDQEENFFKKHLKRFLEKKFDTRINNLYLSSITLFSNSSKLKINFKWINPFYNILNIPEIREKIIDNFKKKLENNWFYIYNKDEINSTIEISKKDMYFKIHLEANWIMVQKFIKNWWNFDKKIIKELNSIVNNVLKN